MGSQRPSAGYERQGSAPDSRLVAAVAELARRTERAAGGADGSRAGYKRFEAPLGIALAGREPSGWSAAQAGGAYYMVGRYRRQLASGGIDWDSIPQPAAGGGADGSRAGGPPAGGRWVRAGPSKGAGSVFVIGFGYDAGLVREVGQIPGRSFDRRTKTWRVPARHEALPALVRFLGDNDFDFSAAVVALIEELADSYERNVEASRAASSQIEVAGIAGGLLPFQRAGVDYALHARRSFIADQMGLGKTVQALAALEASGSFPALVICPASVKLNWAREAALWLPDRPVEVMEGTKPRGPAEGPDDAEITLVNYDILDARAGVLGQRGYEGLVVDESHYVKNPKAKRTTRVKELAKGPSMKLLLSGTPLTNRPEELLPQLQILGRLGDLGGFWEFAQRYCEAVEGDYGWDFSGAAHLSELNERLRAVCYVRRTKDEVLEELPDKRRSIVPLVLDNPQQYRAAEADVIAHLGDTAANDKRRIAEAVEEFETFNGRAPVEEERRMLVRKVRASAEAKAEAAEELVRVQTLRTACAMGKLAGVYSWIKQFLESSTEKLVVFAHHRDVVFSIAARFEAPSITGDDTSRSRQRAVDRFQTDPECRLIVANMTAGGVGITLTAASDVAFVELGWTPAAHDQAEDRAHRIGQKSSVTAWYLLGFATIDDEIHELIERKRTVVDAATEGLPADRAGPRPAGPRGELVDGQRPDGAGRGRGEAPASEDSVYDDLMDRLAARGEDSGPGSGAEEEH